VRKRPKALVELNRYPDVTLGVSPTQVATGSRMGTDVRDQHPAAAESRRAQEREAELNLDAARLRREDALNQVLASVAESIAGLQVAQKLETWLPAACCRRRNSNCNAALAAYETAAPNLPWCSTPSANCAAPAPNWSRRAATSRCAWPRSRKMVGEDL
jgi:hypothetical protein